MNNFKKVSFIIPCLKYRDYILEAIDSIKKQTIQDYEIIVVSNEVDTRLNDLEKLGVKFIQSTNFAPSLKINEGFKVSSGNYITILSDDDKIEPDFIEKMYDENYDVVYSDMQVFGTKSFYVGASDWNKCQFRISTVPFITSMVSRRMFMIVNGYDVINYYDWDFWFKCFEAGAKAKRVRLPLFNYRATETNEASFKQDPKFRDEILAKHKK